MFHACVGKFDVMGVRGNILGWDGEVNKAIEIEIFVWRDIRIQYNIYTYTGKEHVGAVVQGEQRACSGKFHLGPAQLDFPSRIQPTTMIGGCNTHSPSKIQFFTQAHALFLEERRHY
jgi:hypothetical protein